MPEQSEKIARNLLAAGGEVFKTVELTLRHCTDASGVSGCQTLEKLDLSYNFGLDIATLPVLGPKLT